MKKPKLKPCPFCGCKDLEYWELWASEIAFVVCKTCNAGIYKGTGREVVTAWNRRTYDRDKAKGHD